MLARNADGSVQNFYAQQVVYGMGYYYDASSTYGHYYVFITVPANSKCAAIVSLFLLSSPLALGLLSWSQKRDKMG